MARLHLAYKEPAFTPAILELTRRLLRAKPWLPKSNQQRKFETWLHGASLHYGLPCPKLIVAPVPSCVGRYEAAHDKQPAVIYLHRYSLISLFHQYRHHQWANSKNPNGEPEQDAQEWACSLMYIVAPKTFRRAVRAGKVAGVEPKDLLKRKRVKK